VTRAQPVFYYDLASADAYLAGERIVETLGEVPEWTPVALGGVPAFRCREEEEIYKLETERRAVALGLQPLRWPDPFPADSELALLAATYAKEIGRAVAFSLAAFRQAFAGGRDLGELDTVLLAAAACEIHPTALMKGVEMRSTRRRLEEATAAARAAGVLDVPAVVIDGRVEACGQTASTS
jgi:2-hydroxychromene-2-carboxylate isomerase